MCGLLPNDCEKISGADEMVQLVGSAHHLRDDVDDVGVGVGAEEDPTHKEGADGEPHDVGGQAGLGSSHSLGSLRSQPRLVGD